MKGRIISITILIFALLCAGAAAYLTNNYIQTQVSAKENALEAEYKPVEVVVAKYQLKAGDILSSNSVALRKVPGSFVHEDALTSGNFKNFKGLTLSYPINAGEPVLAAHLSSRRGGKFAGLIKEGTRAVTVSIDKLNSNAGMLSPQDKIDLLLTTKASGQLTTTPLLNNITVLATGVETRENLAGEIIEYNSVTFALKPDNAAKVTHAKRIGDISFVLRGINNQGQSFSGIIDTDVLIGGNKKPIKAPVQIIIGGKS